MNYTASFIWFRSNDFYESNGHWTLNFDKITSFPSIFQNTSSYSKYFIKMFYTPFAKKLDF